MLVAPRDFTSTAAVLPLSIPCTPPSNAVAGTPVHNASSAPDISFAVSSLFLKQDEKTNLSELEYQFSSRLGVRGGFRYRHRAIDDSDFETATNIYFSRATATGGPAHLRLECYRTVVPHSVVAPLRLSLPDQRLTRRDADQ